jgi:hypothetical protein
VRLIAGEGSEPVAVQPIADGSGGEGAGSPASPAPVTVDLAADCDTLTRRVRLREGGHDDRSIELTSCAVAARRGLCNCHRQEGAQATGSGGPRPRPDPILRRRIPP